MCDEKLDRPNTSLYGTMEEKNNEIAQLKYEITGLKEQEKKLWEWISEMEQNLESTAKETVSKQVYDELVNTLSLLKNENIELENKVLELKKENELLIEKKEGTSELNNHEKVEVIVSNNDTFVLEYEKELEEKNNQVLELKKLVEETTRENEELCELKDMANNKVQLLENRITELEYENYTLFKKVSDADEYISKQEDEKKKSSEKCQLKEQGCNLFTEIIEGGKKVEDDLKLAYEKFREQQKISQGLRSKLTLLQNELDRKQEELIRYSKKKEVVYTEANNQKLVSLEEHVKDLEKQLADQIKVVNELISSDDKTDIFKYKVENQKLRNEMNRKLERYHSRIRYLSGELDQAKICIEKLRETVVELRSITYKSETYKNTNIENKLHEIQVNFDIHLSSPSTENSVNSKRKLGNTQDIREKIKSFRIDSGIQNEKFSI
ncbi:Hypothetical protein SRAE_2000237900 [Strongyloides ratti]|uniref:Uncharacterized protein n=1 Tax=Strongyloides ratti TaxID=34506 RepID=A0A090LHX0_STRRB|nr:Hypothetical protein SRAE_2000237900 [Strongyloides ratti]CEF67718.1 Hypothetical protein SRAE_2000237900 [Strongyloides ratti]